MYLFCRCMLELVSISYRITLSQDTNDTLMLLSRHFISMVMFQGPSYQLLLE